MEGYLAQILIPIIKKKKNRWWRKTRRGKEKKKDDQKRRNEIGEGSEDTGLKKKKKNHTARLKLFLSRAGAGSFISHMGIGY